MASATNERGIAAAKRQSKADVETDRSVICALMSRVDGRRWLWLKLSSTGLFYEDGDLDHGRMCWKAGVRNEGLILQASIIRHAPAHYTTMVTENSRPAPEEEPQEDSDNA